MAGRATDNDPWVEGDVSPRSSDSSPSDAAEGSTPPPNGHLQPLDEQALLDRDAYYAELRRHHVTHLKERTGQRKSMMKWTLTLATGIIVVSTAAMGIYFGSEWGHIAPAVMVAWFSSVVVEVLGIVYIVASYLFPKDDHAVEDLIAKEER